MTTQTMPFHRYNFDSVEEYLHHRRPYLLIDRVVDISDNEVVTEATVVKEAFFIEGHFPGAPIFPGAMMQELTTQSAGVLIAARYNPMPTFDTNDPHSNAFALGVLVRVHQARYRGFARPGDVLRATVTLRDQVEQLFDFSAVIKVGETPIMRNSFQLANIPSQRLRES